MDSNLIVHLTLRGYWRASRAEANVLYVEHGCDPGVVPVGGRGTMETELSNHMIESTLT